MNGGHLEKSKHVISVAVILCMCVLMSCTFLSRPDGATRLTYSPDGQSSQNPAFSPDGQYIMFTRFLNGYNKVPSELIKINILTGVEEIIIPAENNVEHITAPGPSWVDGRICWSSDMAGYANEIYVANDDGTNIQQITNHPESEGYYHEPVFNPVDVSKIIFEFMKMTLIR